MSAGDDDRLHVGAQVWVLGDALWQRGTVRSIDPLEVEIDGDIRSANRVELCEPNERSHVEDMTKLSFLNEPNVLNNLDLRYQLDEIYTYTGGILIALNPFQDLPHLYGENMMVQYAELEDVDDRAPHAYAIADVAYRSMRLTGQSQSILISGESGAGKTETSKIIMNYLAFLAQRSGAPAAGLAAGPGRDEAGVEQQVLESSPLLESFGNAKTVRNDNSSRFGKFMEVQFRNGHITGAAIRTYLLERSRVTSIADHERSYHIFYQLCDGADGPERARLRLRDPLTFRTLARSSAREIRGPRNKEAYEQTRAHMAAVGIPADDQDACMRVVAAVLHLGDIEFQEGDVPDSSVPTDACMEAVAAAAELLGCTEDALIQALTTKTRTVAGERIQSMIKVADAVISRDALARTLYSRLFDWLVARINDSIGQDPEADAVIGVLDIYGFEHFERNDLEQLCINLANEKLQQHFNSHVFKAEQAEYERDGIEWSYIDFVDNQDVLDLLEGSGGLVSLLDEAGRLGGSHTPEELRDRLASAPAAKTPAASAARFSCPRFDQRAFTVSHYAGDVTYSTDNLLEKNGDAAAREHVVLLDGSGDSFVRALVTEAEGAEARGGAEGGKKGGGKGTSVCARFRGQLGELMEVLKGMQPHYVRCIKPSEGGEAGAFEAVRVLQQLRCGGVLEAVRISCAGYPSRMTLEEFAGRFWHIDVAMARSGAPPRDMARALLERCGISDFQIGRSKVFMRAGDRARMERERAVALDGAARTVQTRVRAHQAMAAARAAFLRARQAALTLQRFARGWAARRAATAIRREMRATQLQAATRGWIARRALSRARTAATTIQAAFRGSVARAAYRTAVAAAREARRKEEAVTALQCAVRGLLARRVLRRLKAEAREASRLLADKSNLERTLSLREQTLREVVEQRDDLKRRLREEAAKREEAARAHEEELARARNEAEAAARAAEEHAREREEAAEAALRRVRLLEEELERERAGGKETKEARAEAEVALEELKKKYVEIKERMIKYRDERNQVVEVVRLRAQENEELRRELQDMRQRVALNSETRAAAVRTASAETATWWGQDAESLTRAVVEFMAADRTYVGRLSVPVSAVVAMRAALHLRVLEHEDAPFFQHVMEAVKGALEKDRAAAGEERAVECDAFWCTWSAAMLSILQALIMAEEDAVKGSAADKTSSFRTIAGVFNPFNKTWGLMRSSGKHGEGRHGKEGGGKDGQAQGNQYPSKMHAIIFKRELFKVMDDTFRAIVESGKKELKQITHRITTAHVTVEGKGILPYAQITEVLHAVQENLNGARMPNKLIMAAVEQLVASVGRELFNAMLIRKELCSFTSGENFHKGLEHVGSWLRRNSFSEDGLAHIMQAANFLNTSNKSQLTYEMVQDILKDLSMTQISQICARYHDDKFGTSSVSPAVLKEIRRNVHDKTYLLDEVPTAVPLDNPSDALTLVARPDLSAPVELPPTCQLDQGLFGFLSERLPAPSG